MSRFTLVDLMGKEKTFAELIRDDSLILQTDDGKPFLKITDLGKKRFKITILAPYMVIGDELLNWAARQSGEYTKTMENKRVQRIS